MKLAAIDIGSNAIRLQVSKVLTSADQVIFKKLEYVRFPLRLGQDVFSEGSISDASQQRFVKLMRAYKLLIDLYEVNAFMAVATSAMREASNGQELVDAVAADSGIQIEVIDGQKEAEMINDAIYSYIGTGPSLHIDVGGGSTELNLYVKHEKIKSESFPIGSVRRLKHHDKPEIWQEMQDWVARHVIKEYKKVQAVGTGGNINKIYEIGSNRHRLGKTKKISIDQAREVIEYIKGFSIEERESALQLNPDRADVILPASDIYLSIMDWAGAKSITVPDVGLKDGIMQHLYRTRETPQ